MHSDLRSRCHVRAIRPGWPRIPLSGRMFGHFASGLRRRGVRGKITMGNVLAEALVT